jgi:hypothetical protein
VKKITIIASLFATFAAVNSAQATTYYVTNVTLDNGFNVSMNGGGYQLAGAIGLTIQGHPNTLWVWCVDFYHDIYLGPQNPALPYIASPVTNDSTGAQSGTGKTLANTPIPGEIATLADIGTGIANANGNPNDLSAIQGAIWSIEYGLPVTSGNAADDALIANYIAFAQQHPQDGDPYGFYPVGAGGQGFGTTQGFSLGVPEPATWAMMLAGFGMIGFAARRRQNVKVAYA